MLIGKSSIICNAKLELIETQNENELDYVFEMVKQSYDIANKDN